MTTKSTTATKKGTKEQIPITPFDNSREQLLTGLAAIDLRVRWAVMRARANGLNPDDAFRGLYISEPQVDALLQKELGQNLWPTGNGQAADLAPWSDAVRQASRHWQARTAATREVGRFMHLEQLRQAFSLNAAEVDTLLLTLAPELDRRYQRLFGYLQDDVTKKQPTVDLALNLLYVSFAERTDNRALFTDEARLIDSRLLIRNPDKSSQEPSLLGQTLRLAANVTEYLLGHRSLDRRLRACAHLFAPDDLPPAPGLPTYLVERLTKAAADRPIFTFRGQYGVGKRAAALRVAQSTQQALLEVNLARLVQENIDLEEGMCLVQRDGRLFNATLYLTEWDTILVENRPPRPLLQQLLDYPGVVIVAGEADWQPLARPLATSAAPRRSILHVQFEPLDYDGRLRVWRYHLPNQEVNLHGLANQFRFTAGQVEDAVATARDLAQWRNEAVSEQDLFAASRAHSNQRLSTLATKIRPHYTWNDIILPQDTLNQLQEMVNVVQQRHRVYGEWGFDRKLALGKGLSALFSGEPGTGKTMAADIIAGDLGLDLYKVDLSTVVSKYIGETEKNLERIFGEAMTSNAILFFDEADAIFGKRSEVKDSHDRYANLEISYLLQRMEAYDGVVILATNLQANLDEAFTRRFTFITHFPFPEAADRERIWHVNLPPETPLAHEVDFGLMARRFRIAGGNIRNIILAAAFLAARKDQSLAMSHLLHATRREYQKMGRLIDEALFAQP